MITFFKIIFWGLVGLLYIGAIYSCIAGAHITFSPLKRGITLTLMLAAMVLRNFIDISKFDPSICVLLQIASVAFCALYVLLCIQTVLLFKED